MILKSWKKVLESDLLDVIKEMKSLISTPAVVILTGPVGAGKTTFSKYFVQSMNIHSDAASSEVLSPTYSIINEMDRFVHADFFRIKQAHEITHLEIPLYTDDKDYFFIEWGRPWINELIRIVDEDFNFYEIEFAINRSVDNEEIPSRNVIFYRV